MGTFEITDRDYPDLGEEVRLTDVIVLARLAKKNLWLPSIKQLRLMYSLWQLGCGNFNWKEDTGRYRNEELDRYWSNEEYPGVKNYYFTLNNAGNPMGISSTDTARIRPIVRDEKL